MYYFYYNQDTGEFAMRTKKLYAFTDMPYIQRERSWDYANYRIDLNTGQPVEKT